jgi:hypothetical protein
MIDMLVPQTIFALVCVVIGATATCAFALYVFRRIRMERPPIGRFNGRDLIVLFAFIVTLPALYLIMPRSALTVVLVVTFMASLSIGYRTVLPPGVLWPLIGATISADIWVARTQMGTVHGWQVYWTLNSILALLGASAVANLYVQGGMRLRHAALFAFALAFYDATFTLVIPLTPKLADAFNGFPLDPSVGMTVGPYNANIGIGDLLVYATFAVAAYKAYGRYAARVAVVLVAAFGAAVPALLPLVTSAFTRGSIQIAVPAQVSFGPAALLGYLWLRRRYGAERTTAAYYASTDALHRAPATATGRPAPAADPDPHPAQLVG